MLSRAHGKDKLYPPVDEPVIHQPPAIGVVLRENQLGDAGFPQKFPLVTDMEVLTSRPDGHDTEGCAVYDNRVPPGCCDLPRRRIKDTLVMVVMERLVTFEAQQIIQRGSTDPTEILNVMENQNVHPATAAAARAAARTGGVSASR